MAAAPAAAASQLVVAAAPAASAAAARRPKRFGHQIPSSITDDPALRDAMAALPPNYNFEVHKTIWRIAQAKAKRVALQFPEGLLMFACTLADIISSFTGAETVIMGDVTYGACCVDDLSASALGCSLLVHYGHSCLVPSLPQDDAGAGHGRSRAPGGASGLVPIPVLYVFVEIAIDTSHFVETVVAHIPGHTRLSLLGTVQFLKAVHGARAPLRERYGTGQGEGGGVDVPQAKPLSAGETLGCTAPRIARAPGATSGPEPESAIVFLADGRFHPEAAMLMNPGVPLYRYDPYSRLLTREEYDHAAMRAHRTRALESARGARVWGLILGTLGRQGSPALLLHLRALLSALGREHVVVLLSEIFPAKLALFRGVDAWVQVACPRLSIDWGHAFDAPLLTTFEAEVAPGAREWRPSEGEHYPMDYYARAGGSYANYATADAREATRAACCEARERDGGACCRE